LKGDSNFMFTRDDNLKAIYSSDLDSFLEKLGLAEKFNQGKLVCRYCKCMITKESLYAIVPAGDTTDFCCNQPECVLSLSEEAKK
jgi:hypothetical protein